MKNIIKILIISMIMVSGDSLFSQENYENAQLIDSNNVASITSYENTPESVVTYFYASKIRNDDKWKEVILSERNRTPRLKKKLLDYDRWTFAKFKLVSKEKSSEKGLWVTIFMEIEVDGVKDEGTDQVTVQLIDGKWMITSVPT